MFRNAVCCYVPLHAAASRYMPLRAIIRAARGVRSRRTRGWVTAPVTTAVSAVMA